MQRSSENYTRTFLLFSSSRIGSGILRKTCSKDISFYSAEGQLKNHHDLTYENSYIPVDKAS